MKEIAQEALKYLRDENNTLPDYIFLDLRMPRISGKQCLEEIRKEMHGMIAEGISTTKAVYEHSKKHNLEMPLTTQAYEVLFENKNIKQAIKDLLYLV